MKIYVSGALSNVPRLEVNKVKNFYEDIADLCQALEFDVYVPHLNTDPVKNADISPQRVFEIDKSKVLEADLMIAYLGYPSLGVGMELAYADMSKIPLVLLYENNKYVSRFPRGIPTIISEMSFASYHEALEKLQLLLTTYQFSP